MGQITKLVYTGIEVCKESKIPVLFISNPGYGKTTLVRNWAEKYNYHVETIIGSSFAKEEVQGYQVNNGKDHLDFLEPYWFTRIKNEKNAGKPTILFIDEISTAPVDVQGSLFRLIFDRCIGNGNKLPEDTLIISAANYKDNLPDFFEISAPALNRFCIINLIPSSTNDMLEEYLSPINEVPTFKKTVVSEEEKNQMKNRLLSELKVLVGNLAKTSIDFTNQVFNDIYSGSNNLAANGKIMNFISGRTLSYLFEIMVAIKSLRLKRSNPFITEAIDGLIGLGTNTFKSITEQKAFLAKLHKAIIRIIFEISPKNVKKEDLESLNISEIVNQISDNAESMELNDENVITYSIVIAEKLQDYKTHFADYVKQNRAFIFSEVMSVQLLSDLIDMDIIFDNQFGKNIIKIRNEIMDMLGETQNDSHHVLLQIKEDSGKLITVNAQQSGRIFIADKDSGINPAKRVLSHSRITSVFTGSSWISLDEYLA